MNDVEKLIAKLIDEHKITGEEAIVLIKNGLWKDISIKPYSRPTYPNSKITWDDSNYVSDLERFSTTQ